MRRFTLLLAATAGFLAGCNESSPTDPTRATPSGTSAEQHTDASSQPASGGILIGSGT